MSTKPHFKITTSGEVKEMVGGAYEGASRTSQEIALWQPPSMSADRELSGDKIIIDSRARDLMRNDGYVAGAIDTHKDSIVGSQFTLNVKPKLDYLKRFNKAFDESWLIEFQEMVETEFTLWGESPDNWIDAQRVNSFTDLIRLGVGTSTFSGEILATAEWIKTGGRPMNTAIQMIDVDRLSNPNGVSDSPRLIAGVEKDRYGAATHHHIRTSHASDGMIGADAYKWKRIATRKPWGRRQVIHLYEQNRASQTRAVAPIVAALKEMKMTKKYKDVVLQNAVMNATFAATIESELPPAATYEQLGAGSESTAASDYMAQVAAYMGSSNNINIDGARIPHLWPGQKLHLQNASEPGGVGDNFEQSLLRHVAAPLGLSYEQFAKDFTQTNYSSARAAIGETGKHMKARKKMFADPFATIIYQLWFEEKLHSGGLLLPSGFKTKDFYQGLIKDALTGCTWIGASDAQIDPLKETKAALMRIQGGLSTYEIESAKLGNDFRDIFAQLEREQKIIEDKGIIIVSGINDPKEELPDAT